MKKNKQNLKGFTLIETFVAITVLMIVVLGPMSLLSRALKDARYIGDEITATYLAQEGVELMIDQRNNIPGVPNPKPYNCLLKFDPDEGYQCDTGENSIFKRDIEVNPRGFVPKQYEVVSTISRSGFKDVVSSTIIFIK